MSCPFATALLSLAPNGSREVWLALNTHLTEHLEGSNEVVNAYDAKTFYKGYKRVGERPTQDQAWGISLCAGFGEDPKVWLERRDRYASRHVKSALGHLVRDKTELYLLEILDQMAYLWKNQFDQPKMHIKVVPIYLWTRDGSIALTKEEQEEGVTFLVIGSVDGIDTSSGPFDVYSTSSSFKKLVEDFALEGVVQKVLPLDILLMFPQQEWGRFGVELQTASPHEYMPDDPWREELRNTWEEMQALYVKEVLLNNISHISSSQCKRKV